MAATSRFAVALHLLTSLAVERKGPKIPLTSAYLARSVNTNAVVIRRLLGLLAKQGLVLAQPGKGGGVALARPARSIRLLDVYRAVQAEGPFSFNRRPANPDCPVSRHMREALVPIFAGVDRALETSLGRQTLAQLSSKIQSFSAN